MRYLTLKNFKTDFNKRSELFKLKSVWIAFLLFFLNANAYATYTVTGCVSDDTGYLYTNPSGVNSPRPGGYGPAYEVSPVITAAQIGTGIYCYPVVFGNCVIRTRSRCTECTGPYDYDSSRKNENWYYEQAGKYKGYMNCPIDDYIGLMLVAVGGLGFVVIRKSSLFA